MKKGVVTFWEYDRTHVNTMRAHVLPSAAGSGRLRKGCLNSSDVVVGDLKLSVALARSGATLAPDKRVGFWRAMAAYARVREACLWQGNELRARPHLLATLRDSSRTALAGDLGQAITWLYATEKLKMSAVVDFGTGCGLLSTPAPAPKSFNKRPDFMASKGPIKNIVLLESKGVIVKQASDVSWRSDLVEGLGQTAAGAGWLSSHGSSAIVMNKYAIGFGLVETGPSVAVVVDPPERADSSIGDDMSLAFLRNHVSNWALAAGQFRLAVALERPGATREKHDRVDQLHDVEVQGKRMKGGRYSGVHPPFCPVGPIHLISTDLIHAIARDDLDGALDAISSFNTPLTGGDSIELEPQGDEAELIEDGPFGRRSFLLPDGTGATW